MQNQRLRPRTRGNTAEISLPFARRETPRTALPRRVGGYDILALVSADDAGQLFRVARGTEHPEFYMHAVSPRLMADEAYRAEFLRQARLKASLEHPLLLRTLDVSAAESPRLFEVTEIWPGVSLADRLEHASGTATTPITLPIEICAALGVAIADLLATCHAANVLHLNLSPAAFYATRDAIMRVTAFRGARNSGNPAITACIGPDDNHGTLAPELLTAATPDARTSSPSAPPSTAPPPENPSTTAPTQPTACAL